MDDMIINRIIDITRQRDMDSLELTFINSLADIVPAKTISIYRSFNGSFTNSFNEAFLTSISKDNNKWVFINEKKIITTSKKLKQCLQSASIIQFTTNDGLKHSFYPFFIEKKVAGAIYIECSCDTESYQKLIKSMIDIYSNHLTVLNESERDKLTTLLNRRTFDNRLNKLLDSQHCKQKSYQSSSANTEKRHYKPELCSWLAMLDIDNFKNINDEHGHLFGDEVILTLSQQMRLFFRYSDLLFRFGGEEFVVILEPTSPDMAKQTFERFGQVVANYKFPQIDKITISTGYARITMNDYTHVILERADRALYYAKQHGKNCVYNYEELVSKKHISERKSGEATTFFDN